MIRQANSHKHGRAPAFTLVEMIVATFLLAIGVVAAVAAVSSATEAGDYATHLDTAALLARQRMAQIALHPEDLGHGETSGQFDADHPGYRWRETVDSTEYPDLFRVTVRVEWNDTGRTRFRELVTYLRQPSQQGSQPQTGRQQ